MWPQHDGAVGVGAGQLARVHRSHHAVFRREQRHAALAGVAVTRVLQLRGVARAVPHVAVRCVRHTGRLVARVANALERELRLLAVIGHGEPAVVVA
jgi:hypothetical protein